MSLHVLVMILHVLGAGVVIGVAFLSLFAVIKPPVTAQGLDRLRFIGRFGRPGSTWMFVTGIFLAYQDWGEFSHSPLFWTKMTLYVVEGFLAATLIGKQAGQSAAQLQSGNTNVQGRGLRNTLLAHAVLIVLIASLGVLLVSGGKE